MPRINVDDEFFEDYRLKLLREKLGSDLLALGSVLRLWKLAQNFWRQGRKPIPTEAFRAFELPDALIDVGFARKVEGGYYAAGADERFGWLANARDSGREGGKKSAAARTNKINNVVEGFDKGFQPSSSSSSSSSSSKEEIHSTSKEQKSSAPALPRLALLWNEHCGALLKVKGCSATRTKNAQARWREKPEEKHWVEVIRRIAASDFCNGRVKDKPWRASFDFLLRPDTHHKALEGQYDNKRPASVRRDSNPYVEELRARGEIP